MNILDLMMQGYDHNAMPLPAVPTASPQEAAPPPSPAAPSIMDLVQQPSSPPPLPQAEGMDMLPALALLRFAAQFSQPKARGQSTVGKFFQSAADAGGYFMNEKKNMEDRGVQKELQRHALGKAQSEAEDSRLGTIKKRQEIIEGEEQRPARLEQLRLAIENAKTEQEVKALQLRVAKIKEKYSEDMAKAELAEKQGKDPESRARAARDQAAAALAIKQVQELVTLAELKARRQNTRSLKIVDSADPGGPQLQHDETTGEIRRLRMAPAAAEAYAKQQAEAEGRMRGLKASEIEDLQRRYYNELTAGDPAPTAAPKQQQPGAPAGAAPQSPPQDKLIESAKPQNRNKLMRDPATDTYYVNGRQLTPEQVARAKAAMAAAEAARAGGGTPPPAPITPFTPGGA